MIGVIKYKTNRKRYKGVCYLYKDENGVINAGRYKLGMNIPLYDQDLNVEEIWYETVKMIQNDSLVWELIKDTNMTQIMSNEGLYLMMLSNKGKYKKEDFEEVVSISKRSNNLL